MEFDTKFQMTVAELKTKANLPEAFMTILRDAMLKAGFATVSAAPAVAVTLGASKATPKGGRRTGYNLFASAKNVELKASTPDWPTRNKAIGAQWKALSETDRAAWNAKAAGESSGSASPVRAKTGYNLYMKEQMPLLKAAHPNPSDRFSLIGKQWKALSQTERDVYNAKAKGVAVPVTAAPAPAQEPSEEEIEEIEEPEDDQ
jgi:hypothetical protein